MDTTACIESATRAGIMREALPDALNRATSHFAGVQPSQDALDTYYQQTLRDLAPHFWPPVVTKAPPAPALDPQQRFGVPAEVWAKMSPEDRYTYARRGQPPVQRQRPQKLTLRPEQVAELAGLTPIERLSRYRDLQAQHRGH